MSVTDGPLILLDLDGVLNPFAATTCPPGYPEHAGSTGPVSTASSRGLARISLTQ
jgi:hypothetical protein